MQIDIETWQLAERALLLIRYDSLFKEVVDHPHNPDKWRTLIQIAEHTDNSLKVRSAYDALLKQYPNTASFQIRYLTILLRDESCLQQTQELFRKFLVQSPCVALWTFYLKYVRKENSSPVRRHNNNIYLAYQFALSHVGHDKDSGPLWTDYIELLKNTNCTTKEQREKTNLTLRQAYHKAVKIPLVNLDKLWQALEHFEITHNKMTAKKTLINLSVAYNQARTVLQQLTTHLSQLYDDDREELHLPRPPLFDLYERTLVGKWKAYLRWEESNPLQLEDKDKLTLMTRIRSAYQKAVIRMRYYPEIWYMAHKWTDSVGKHDEAISILKAGMEANPSSFLLTFTYAEVLEIQKRLSEVHAVYKRFLQVLRTRLDNMERQEGTGSSPEDQQPMELHNHRTEYGLVWTVYMRFALRAEGVQSARNVFSNARKDKWTPWQVHEASALIEYHYSDDKLIATRIFEKGLDVHGEEIEYVVQYLSFLISINDTKNARALFERVVGKYPVNRARPLWECWMRYEYRYGELEETIKLEKRMSEAYPNDPPMKAFAQRYICFNTDAIAERDLGFALARHEISTGQANLSTLQTQQKRTTSPNRCNELELSNGGDSPIRKRARLNTSLQ